MEPAEYDNIARVQARHWWYRGMSTISLQLLSAHLRATDAYHADAGTAQSNPRSRRRILDAGCGPGGLLSKLEQFGDPVGLDFHPLALAYAQSALAPDFPLVQGSVTRLPLDSRQFDVIVSMDVLYHQAVTDDQAALLEFWRALKPGGVLLLRVPALELLRGGHDVIVHTRHRYTGPELARKLRAAGFKLHRLTYANTLLLPMVFLKRRWPLSPRAAETDVDLPSPLLNSLLEALLRLESRWLAALDLPIGVSLLSLATRPAS